MRAAGKQAQPISAPDSVLFFSLLMREQNGGATEVLRKTFNQGYRGCVALHVITLQIIFTEK